MDYQKLKASFFYLTILFFIISLPYKLIISNISFILILIAWIINGVKVPVFKNHSKFYYVVIFSLLFLIQIPSLLYTSDLEYGFKLLQRKLPILLFPIVIATVNIDKTKQHQRLNRLLWYFVYSCLIASTICLVSAIFSQWSNFGFNLKNIDWSVFTYHKLTEVLGIHSIYFALQIGMANIFITYKLFFNYNQFSPFSRLKYVTFFIFFFLIMLLLTTRMVILAFLLIVILSVIRYIVINRKIIQGTVIITSILLLLISMVYFNPVLKDRVKEAVNYKSKYSVDRVWGGRGLRLLKWDCSWALIKQNPILGVGLGDVQENLQNCYEEKNYGQLLFWKNIQYNAHNQYLQIYLEAGFPACLMLFLCFVVPFITSVKEKNFLYIMFLVFIFLCFMTESILVRQRGIMFYAFFNSLLAFYPPKHPGKSDLIQPKP